MPTLRMPSRLVAAAVLLLLLAAAGGLAVWRQLAAPDTAALSDAEKKAAVYAMYELYRREFPEVAEISARELLDRLAAGEDIAIVDIREDRERIVSTIPGAISERELRAAPERFRGRLVVGYCTISYRSGKLARAITRLGLNYANLRGGLLAWVLEGGTLVDPQGKPTRRMHVYGADWNYPAAGYEATW